MSTLTVKVLTVILPGVKVLRSPHLPGGMVDLLPTLWAPGGAHCGSLIVAFFGTSPALAATSVMADHVITLLVRWSS